MAETTEIIPKQPETPSQKPPTNNPFVFISNIPKCLLNSLMNFNNKNKKKVVAESETKVTEQVFLIDDTKTKTKTKTPDVVVFPKSQQDVPSMKLENDDVKEDTNPIILWQVYALGGFIILKWAWGKWQEMKAKNEDKDSPDEDDPPAEPAEE